MIRKLWVRIWLGAGLFPYFNPLSNSAQEKVPQRGASLLIYLYKWMPRHVKQGELETRLGLTSWSILSEEYSVLADDVIKGRPSGPWVVLRGGAEDLDGADLTEVLSARVVLVILVGVGSADVKVKIVKGIEVHQLQMSLLVPAMSLLRSSLLKIKFFWSRSTICLTMIKCHHQMMCLVT